MPAASRCSSRSCSTTPTWERIALPFAKNLERLGITARVRVVDAAQYEKRMDDFDFDMVVGRVAAVASPGNEQREFWSSQTAGERGSRNLAGIKDPAVDRLIDLVIQAPDRPEPGRPDPRARSRAAVGALRHPHWHIRAFRVVYWDKFARPAVSPKYALGFDTWWVDAAEGGRPRPPKGRGSQVTAARAPMLAYLVRRLLLFVPTLFGIMVVNFIVVQAAPGGPVELMISRLRGQSVEATARVGGSGAGETRAGPSGGPAGDVTDKYRGARGIDPELIRQLERQYGFDRPAPERFVRMLRSYLAFDFGSSFYRDRRVIDLIVEKLPVSISLGLWTDAARLPRVDPARHRQGRARRLDVRRLDQRRRHRRLRDPQLPVRHPADRPVRRAAASSTGSAPRPRLRPLAGALLAGPHRRLLLAHHAADRRRSSSAGSPR